MLLSEHDAKVKVTSALGAHAAAAWHTNSHLHREEHYDLADLTNSCS